jgi:putative nucleotidyltransferase with HDIG domain
MLKKIPVRELRLGMYIEKIVGSWMESPFWQKHLLLERQEDLQRILGSAIKEVWVDFSKSRIVAPSSAGVLAGQGSGADDGDEGDGGADAELPAAQAQESQAVPQAAAGTAPRAATPVRPPRPALRAIAPVSMGNELKRAAALIKKSREAVHSMFTEARMGKAVTVDDAMPLVEEISESVMRNAGAMIGLARLKTADDYTYMHSVAVCALMIALGRQLELDDEQIRQAGLAGLLHDIGKMAIPAPILNKPGKLTDEEFHVVKQHPSQGHHMLLATQGMPAVALDVCLHHHEKIDGTGYPEGLKGEQISLFARMGAICDVYDAVTSNRPYKRGWCPAESLRRMAEWSKGHFDERIFAAFIKCIGIYPVGTLVRLKSERLGVVVELSAGQSLIKPKVRVFYSAKGRSYLRPELIDLASPAVTDSIVAREDAATWGLQDIERYWSGAIEFA